MANPRDGPNPLRPYSSYSVPSPLDPSSTRNLASGSNSSGPSPGSGSGLGSSRRGILPDLDYGDYLPDSSPSIAEGWKAFLDEELWRYSSVLLAQPFELAKTVLQVQDAGAVVDPTRAEEGQGDEAEGEYDRDGQDPYDVRRLQV